MRSFRSYHAAVLGLLMMALVVSVRAADEKPAPPTAAKTEGQPAAVYPVAILPFAVRGDMKDAGATLALRILPLIVK